MAHKKIVIVFFIVGTITLLKTLLVLKISRLKVTKNLRNKKLCESRPNLIIFRAKSHLTDESFVSSTV
jgi:hypothetical protein